jgi:pimeloyl-ACP methyl ester carboxylesterase
MADQTPTAPFTLPWLPAGRVVSVAGRGEFFIRHHRHADPTAPTVLLLHGWTASSDLQFFTAYERLADVCSFVGIDHRGHGRGLRTPDPFTLEDAADDAAAVLRELGIEGAIAIGYSMGGPISMLFARRHPDLARGLITQATALEWNGTLRERLQWRWLPLMASLLRSRTAARFMKRFLERMLHDGHVLRHYVPWMRGESQRADIDTIVEAGRALSAYDATAWASTLGVPAGMLVTTNDRLVKPRKQRALAAALGAEIREIPTDHLGPWERPDQFVSATVELLAVVSAAASPVGSAPPMSSPSASAAVVSAS